LKEKIKDLIAEHLSRRGSLKVRLYNLNEMGTLTEEIQNYILDEIGKIDESIAKLTEILRILE
jgi:hypothetical protein